MKTYVLYHGNCPDGTGAALAAYVRLGDFAGIKGASFPVEYIPVSYGKPPPEMEPGSVIYVVDFSYGPDVLTRLAQVPMEKIFVLDHHATAEQDLKNIPLTHAGVIFVKFDMAKSGAVLAWEHFHPEKPVPPFILYLQDRDLWQFKLPKSREVSAAISSYPMDFRVWKNWLLEETIIDDLAIEGEVCLRLKKQQVDNMAKYHRWAYLDPDRKTIRFTQKLEPGGNGDPMVPEI